MVSNNNTNEVGSRILMPRQAKTKVCDNLRQMDEMADEKMNQAKSQNTIIILVQASKVQLFLKI